MADSWNWPALINKIAQDVPFLQRALNALLKQDPTSIEDAPSGAKRLYEVSSGKWQWQEYNGSSWAAVPFLQHSVDQLDGYHAAITPAANTVAVRNASGLLQDSITGNAATASSAATLSETLPVNKGGTGATTSAAARTNLGVPPTSHTSTATTYGVGNATQYGHLKLSDATDSASGVSGGVAATPAAVKAAKDAADAAMTKASTLATSSTPGIVKPGTGLQIGGEGALNVVAEQTGCLPLAGGTMTGVIKADGEVIIGQSSNSSVRFFSNYDKASALNLFGRDFTGGYAGVVELVAENNTQKSALALFPNGACRLNGYPITTPVGTVIAYAANSVPEGYLLCNGAAVSRTTYAALFATIGMIYGAGDGSTTFNLPNLTDRFIQGSGTAGTVKYEGLPNLYGKFAPFRYGVTVPDKGVTEGVFSNIVWGGSQKLEAYIGTNETMNEMQFNAAQFNSIYGNSPTVQPPALTMRYYIKY